jgi:hypothetical protein
MGEILRNAGILRLGRMKTIFNLSALILLLFAAPRQSVAMMSIEEVTKVRAKELGMEIRVTGAGPDVVRVELAFDTKSALKGYSRVDLESREGGKMGGKLLVSSSLKEEPSKAGRVVVSFAADRTNLDTIWLRVVTGVPLEMVGHCIRVKDFVEIEKAK